MAPRAGVCCARLIRISNDGCINDVLWTVDCPSIVGSALIVVAALNVATLAEIKAKIYEVVLVIDELAYPLCAQGCYLARMTIAAHD